MTLPAQQIQWGVRFRDEYGPNGAPVKHFVLEVPAVTVVLPMDSAQLRALAAALVEAADANAHRLHRVSGNGSPPQ
jgi:hypothetical protein